MEVSTSTYTLRLATLADAALLSEFGAQTFYEAFGSHNTKEDIDLYMAKTFTVEQLRSELNDPASTFVLAQDGDEVAGYTKMKTGRIPQGLEETNVIEIERIYSSGKYIGKKVGKTLMQACIKIASERGYKIIWLGVWEHNPRAIAFYEKWGFEKFGTHPFMLGTDLQTDIEMKKIIL